MTFLHQKNLNVYNISTPSSNDGPESVLRILATCPSYSFGFRLKHAASKMCWTCACQIFEYFHNLPVDQRILKIEQDLTLFEATCLDLARLKAWSKPLKVRP